MPSEAVSGCEPALGTGGSRRALRADPGIRCDEPPGIQRFHERLSGRVVLPLTFAHHADRNAVSVLLAQVRVIAAGLLRTAVGLVGQNQFHLPSQ